MLEDSYDQFSFDNHDSDYSVVNKRTGASLRKLFRARK